MRSFALAAIAVLLLTTVFATTASANPLPPTGDCDHSAHADGNVVSVNLDYGVGCVDPTIKLCTFGLDPTRPESCRYI